MTKSKRPNEHIKAQKKVKDIEGYKCAICRRVTNNSQGHHLIPYSRGGSSDQQNMITMCTSCHRDYHNGKLNVDIYRF